MQVDLHNGRKMAVVAVCQQKAESEILNLMSCIIGVVIHELWLWLIRRHGRHEWTVFFDECSVFFINV